jgi:hypothetical protein
LKYTVEPVLVAPVGPLARATASVGAVLSTRTLLTVGDVNWFPALSVVITRRSYGPSLNVAVFQLAEYGDAVSAAPRFDHDPAPAGETWNCAEATPLVTSAESEVTVSVPAAFAPVAGAVTVPVGDLESMVTELLVPLAAVHEWKYAVTRHSNVPSPGTSEQLSAAIRIDAVVPQTSFQVEPDASRRSIPLSVTI